MNNQWISLLGLANRARQVISGEELALKEIRSKNAKLVLLSNDASNNTSKKIRDKCQFYNIPIRNIPDLYLLGQAIGKEARVVVVVLDAGFAKKLLSLLD